MRSWGYGDGADFWKIVDGFMLCVDAYTLLFLAVEIVAGDGPCDYIKWGRTAAISVEIECGINRAVWIAL